MSRIAPLSEDDLPAACAHLVAADPVLAGMVDRVGPLSLGRRLAVPASDHFAVLVMALVGQRSSERATMRVLAALRTRFDGAMPSPRQLVDAGSAELVTILGSERKVGYLLDLAGLVDAGRLDLGRLDQLSDECVGARLQAVRGIGPWSVEQFLFWHLRRPDVLASRDPAVVRTFERAYPNAPGRLEATAETWRPWRAVACRYLLASERGPGLNENWPWGRGRPATW